MGVRACISVSAFDMLCRRACLTALRLHPFYEMNDSKERRLKLGWMEKLSENQSDEAGATLPKVCINPFVSYLRHAITAKQWHW